MTYLSSFEEFSRVVERLFSADPKQCRFIVKYNDVDGYILLKISNNSVCVGYKTQYNQDVKKIERLIGHLVRHMASKEK